MPRPHPVGQRLRPRGRRCRAADRQCAGPEDGGDRTQAGDAARRAGRPQEGLSRGSEKSEPTLAQNELDAAIAASDRVVHYQPKIDLQVEAAWRNVRAEALVRSAHLRRGLVPPNEFIGLAQRTDLILPPTEFVLGTAIDQVKAWQDSGMPIWVA